MSYGKESKAEAAQKEVSSSLESVWTLWTKWLKRAGLASTLFGTFLALLYFYKIGHMPLDSLSSLAGLSTAIAFVSIGGLGILTALWGIPGLLMHIGFREFPREGEYLFRRRDTAGPIAPVTSSAEQLAEARAATEAVQVDPAAHEAPPSLWRSLAWSFGTLGLPWLALLALLAPDSFAGCEWTWLVPSVAMGVAVVLTLGVIFGLDPFRSNGWHVIKAAWPTQHKLLLPTLFYVLVSVFGIVAFVPVAGFHANSGASGFLTEVVVCIVTAVGLNALAIAMAFRNRNSTPAQRAGAILLYVMLVISTIVLMLSVFRAWDAVHEWVMIKANVRIPRVTLTLEKAACDALPSTLIQAVTKRSANDPQACIVRDALVLSGVGSRWLVAVPRLGCGRYVIKSEHVQLAEMPEVRKLVMASAACPASKAVAVPPIEPLASNCVF